MKPLIPKYTTLANAWLHYMDVVIHPQAGQIQIAETKRAFYAGAAAIFQLLIMEMPNENGEDACAQFTINLDKELRKFAKEIGTSQ